MGTSIAIIILLGLLGDYLFSKIKIPGLVAMLFVGMLCGPYTLNVLDVEILNVSYELRLMAFMVLLLRAGLTLNKATIKKVGKTVAPLGLVPATLEAVTITAFSYYLLPFSLFEAAFLGIILSAISPAVVIPRMIYFSEHPETRHSKLPSLIIASSSIDNVFILTVFSAAIGFYIGQEVNLLFRIVSVPLSILTGVMMGVCLAYLLIRLFKAGHIRSTKKTLLVLGIAVLISDLEKFINGYFPFSAIMAVLAIGYVLLDKSEEHAHQVSHSLQRVWIFAELILFVLVGASIDIQAGLQVGLQGIAIICVGLFARSIGVYLSLLKSGFSNKEKIFCIAAYLPKATVQALLAAVPLSLGVAHGEIILAIAIFAIIFTAPLGAFAIEKLGSNSFK